MTLTAKLGVLLAVIGTTGPLGSGGVALAATPAGDRVKIDSGEIQGAVSGGVVAFKGIPFAAPPVGDLRWRPPQPVAGWKEGRPAQAYGHDCMQDFLRPPR
jgi:para-nitrobenzyl esterase